MLKPLRQKKMWFGQPLDAGLLSFGQLDKYDDSCACLSHSHHDHVDEVCRMATSTDKRGDKR